MFVNSALRRQSWVPTWSSPGDATLQGSDCKEISGFSLLILEKLLERHSREDGLAMEPVCSWEGWW